MGKINSRRKGADGEVEMSHWLKERGVKARRGQQFAGGGDSPDIIHNLPNIHIEVKRVEGLSIYPAMEQAIRDAAPENRPVVLHRRNGKPWISIMLAEDWLKLVDPRRDEIDALLS